MKADLPLGDLARIVMLALHSDERPVRRRSMTLAVAAGVVFAVTGAAAFVCLFAALWIWIRPIVGLAAAALVLGTSLAATAALSVAILHWATCRVAAPRAAAASELRLEDLKRLMASNKIALLLAAALAGLVAAGSIG